ncbi:LamG-like jellyroll fold domain-containing protein, partial [Hymenobacter crusticola]
ATAVNNGSTAGCGPLTLQVQKLGVYGQVTEGGMLTLTAPAGAVFTAVDFASYGTPTGSEGNYVTSGCHAPNSASIVESYLLGKNSASIPATNGVFGDPCVGTVKKLAVRATYTLTAPASQVTYSCSEVGTNLVRLIVTDANGNTSIKTATVTVQDNLAPIAIAQNVSVMLNQSGNATLTPAMINASSTDNCSIAALSIAPNTFSCTDVNPNAATNPSLAFNGSTQYVEGTHALLPSGNAARTLEAWVYPTAANSNGVIFNYGTPTTNLRSGLIMSNGNLYYVGEYNDLRGNIPLSPNAWHHVAATYDGTTLRLYVDGVLDVATNPAPFNTTGTTWRIAQRAAPQSGEFLTGRLDEVRVWSRALLAAEITQSASRVNPASLAGLVARWDMREAAGTSLSDMTGNSTPGTLYNAPVWTTPGVAYQGVMTTLTVTDASGNSSRAQATVMVSVPTTATTTWNGSSSNAWSDCSNWSYGKVPDATTHVIIPASLSRYPTLASGTLTAANLTIASGANFTLDPNASLEVYGDWTNNGAASLAGTVSFRGATTQNLGGTSLSSFAKLTVNKTGTLTLQRAATVTGTLTMTSGMLATDVYELTTTGASLVESSSSYVLGTTLSTATLNTAGTRYSFGNLGLALTPTGTTLPGATTVRRVTGTALTGQGTSVSIKRYYDIQAAIDAGLNVTLEFGYFDTELNGVSEGQLTLFRSSTGTTG